MNLKNDMTRQEFCNLLVQAKETSKASLKDVLNYVAQLSIKKIDIIECGVKDFLLSDALLYVQMCDTSFEFSGYGYDFINTIDEVRKFLIKERKEIGWSVIELAKHARVSLNTIYAFENGRCDLRIDTFLKLADALEIKIEI